MTIYNRQHHFIIYKTHPPSFTGSQPSIKHWMPTYFTQETGNNHLASHRELKNPLSLKQGMPTILHTGNGDLLKTENTQPASHWDYPSPSNREYASFLTQGNWECPTPSNREYPLFLTGNVHTPSQGIPTLPHTENTHPPSYREYPDTLNISFFKNLSTLW